MDRWAKGGPDRWTDGWTIQSFQFPNFLGAFIWWCQVAFVVFELRGEWKGCLVLVCQWAMGWRCDEGTHHLQVIWNWRSCLFPQLLLGWQRAAGMGLGPRYWPPVLADVVERNGDGYGAGARTVSVLKSSLVRFFCLKTRQLATTPV
jgi:hypothetical protein